MSQDNNGYLPFPKGFATKSIHAGHNPDQWDSMCVIPPLVQSTTYVQYAPKKPKKYVYGRSGNPTREVLDNCLAALDGAKYGLTFSSGMGAETVIFSMLKAGDHIVCGDDVYGGTFRLLNQVIPNHGIQTTHVDACEPSNVQAAIKPNTKMIWIETPTNPLLKVVDIEKVSQISKKNNLILVVDNTFLTAYLQRPLTLGADIVMYSLTKYVNGHSDVLMGAVTLNNEEIYTKLKVLQNTLGIVPSPFDCYQVSRGLKTLSLRMKQHSKNALAIAKYLQAHPKVEKVLHPGLPNHPQYEIFKKQTSGHSGMVSFYIRNGTIKESTAFISSLKIFVLAESLGGFESLAEVPSVMTHASVAEDVRKTLGITDNLIRMSVGIEDEEDLIEDLKQALNQI